MEMGREGFNAQISVVLWMGTSMILGDEMEGVSTKILVMS